MKMSNKVYDVLKVVALIVTALLGFVVTVAANLGLPHAGEIAIVVTALDTLIGALVQIASKIYKGNVTIDVDGEEL